MSNQIIVYKKLLAQKDIEIAELKAEVESIPQLKKDIKLLEKELRELKKASKGVK
jgi:hypothetical protein